MDERGAIRPGGTERLRDALQRLASDQLDHRLEIDPDEMHDLSQEPVHANRGARMTAQLAKAQQHYGDSQPLTIANPKPAVWTPPVQP